ncbi:MAG: helix-turn-helix transcriptional regulator [Lachnospiraceae bacterium]|nr:helix-turn-helix transcriptional regulator [Lachnospiraceae bacterium]
MDTITIGTKLKEARKKKNLSQEDVSKQLMISRQSISKWENDVCLPDLDNFQKICELYEMDSNDFLNQKKSSCNSDCSVLPSESQEAASQEEPETPELNSPEKETEKEETADTIESTIEEVKNRYFFIPFFVIFYIRKRLYRTYFSKKTLLLLLLNILISLFVVYAIYCEIPKKTHVSSKFFLKRTLSPNAVASLLIMVSCSILARIS